MFFRRKKEIQISEAEDAAFCKDMLDDYMRDTDPNKYGGIELMDLAVKLGIDLNGI